ncbi:hypothetical protein CIHG_08315 [Coccidioides immitis H538.4]|uniref:Uncharacterized protein n=3 Tax=Coccidioides immitis TaxID=5501 RepID=A0A0J8TLE2_COCIT|nr:hypothetical protein CIRG_02274 [Coccidioides immitis RMSCC 2394]KMU74507.1 hypothetical protein CISG_04214 [Coccidioides immitis RMSCC 3703]KMU90599.1 hypothetical protein CIHG_08315 [Coccidioides immitis H538.4]
MVRPPCPCAQLFPAARPHCPPCFALFILRYPSIDSEVSLWTHQFINPAPNHHALHCVLEMHIFTITALLLAAFIGQSSAFLFSPKWKYDPGSGRCWTVPFLMWGQSDPRCPIPPPDPKQVAQQTCTNRQAGSIAVFKADGSHYGCFNPTCNGVPGPWVAGVCA